MAENFFNRLRISKGCISARYFRISVYLGLLFVITTFFIFLSRFYISKIESVLNEEIEKFETGIIDEKKILLKKSVDKAISIIKLEKSSVSDKSEQNIIKNQIKKNLGRLLLVNNCYIWVNRIENYKGGDYYAVREIVPNMSQSEGSWLSTGIEDIKGNMPYKTELEGLKKEGEIFYEYHLKKINSEDTDRRLIYAKLYKPYNWVVATGVYLDSIDTLVRSERRKITSDLVKIKKNSITLFLSFTLVISLFLFVIERKLGKVFKSLDDEITENKRKINEISVTDSLTDVNSRRRLNEFLEYEIAKAKRYNKIFSIILLDFDKFSEINSLYGREKGDAILKISGTILKNCIRTVDIVGRWEGEEFLIICPETDINGARNLAEKIRKTISSTSFPISGQVTASFGTSTFYDRDSIQSLLNRADRALYKAKESGRNKVE